MSLHYAATGTRTLCGRSLSPRLNLAPLWADFLREFEAKPSNCCGSCLRYARQWQRFARDLAAVRLRRRRSHGLASDEPDE